MRKKFSKSSRRTSRRKSSRRSKVKIFKDFSLNHRMAMFNTIISKTLAYTNGENVCINNDDIFGQIDIVEKFGTPSAYGEAWIGKLRNKEKTVVAIKKVVLEKLDKSGEIYSKTQFMSGDSAWTEMVIYKLCTLLVFVKVAPNLPITFRYYNCPNCRLTINPQKNQQCVISINEMGEGDLKMFIEKKSNIWTYDLVENCIFQIIAGLYALKKFFNLEHNDLHWGNVLVHVVKPGGYWEYTIDGNVYNVPNLGYIFVLWDFGMSNIPGKIKGKINPSHDISVIATIMYETIYLEKGKKERKGGIMDHILSRTDFRLTSMITSMFGASAPFSKSAVPSGDLLDSFSFDISANTIRYLLPTDLAYLVN